MFRKFNEPPAVSYHTRLDLHEGNHFSALFNLQGREVPEILKEICGMHYNKGETYFGPRFKKQRIVEAFGPGEGIVWVKGHWIPLQEYNLLQKIARDKFDYATIQYTNCTIHHMYHLKALTTYGRQDRYNENYIGYRMEIDVYDRADIEESQRKEWNYKSDIINLTQIDHDNLH